MLFPTHPIPEGMLRPSFVSPRRKEGPPCIWDTHGISGNVFANPHASSSAPFLQELNPWNSSTEEPLHSSTVEKMNRRSFTPSNVDSRCKGNSEEGIKGGHKEGTKNRRQGKSTLLHWWTSATSKSTSASRECSQEQSQVCEWPRWRSCAQTSRGDRWSRKKSREVRIGTITHKTVGDWHQWKVARTNS